MRCLKSVQDERKVSLLGFMSHILLQAHDFTKCYFVENAYDQPIPA